jgi:hypothetical protein
MDFSTCSDVIDVSDGGTVQAIAARGRGGRYSGPLALSALAVVWTLAATLP